MKSYYIADLKCNMQLSGRSLRQGEPYVSEAVPYSSPDITIEVSSERISRMTAKYPTVSRDEAEYYLSGYDFYKQLLSFQGCFLHASAVALENRAYLFSADSGVGKSTHTGLWLKQFSEAFIINDDKPALRFLEGRFFAYGTPWSGKTDLNKNVKVPLAAICFLKRGTENAIRKLSTAEAIGAFMRQTYNFHFREETTDKLLAVLNDLFERHCAYELTCLPNDAAVSLAYKVLKEV